MRRAKLTLLFACKLLGLFYLARRLTRGRLKILCYHGFELQDETSFRPKLFIKRARFEDRLRTIKRLGFKVLPLDGAVERLYAGTLPENALVITVDDGFNHRARDLFPFGQGQRPSRAASRGRTDPTCRCQNRLYRRVVPIKQLGDLLERLTLLPALPHQRLLALRVMDSRSLLHVMTH